MKTTIITLAYNHERYIHESLVSVLVQTRPADEIIVIDDASPDGTATAIEGFIREHPEGPIRFIRNERNLGLTGSFAKAVAMASGDILIMMAGDDVSAPDRVERSLAYFADHPSAMALIANADIIDDDSRTYGVLDNCAGIAESAALSLEGLPAWAYFLRGRSSCGATAAYRAEVFRAFSPLRVGLYAEDDPAAFRAMLLGTCDFLPEPLVRWRRHANNLSYAGGSKRGPEMAVHFRKCEAMVDQMIADADEWKARHRDRPGAGFDHAVTTFRFHKAKWALWAAAHERGLSLLAFFLAARNMAECRPTLYAFLKETWRPACRMFMPFSLQRLLANLSSHR
ncbi:MAG: glycosyltransferase [Verrucomicrobiota bacterium]